MMPEIVNTTETDAAWAEAQLNLFRKGFDPILAEFLVKETEEARIIRGV